ncbi:MAG: hypothetical protein AVDCRST_MAG36-1983, partial [uncultured Nocardioidaceae bacterium]
GIRPRCLPARSGTDPRVGGDGLLQRRRPHHGGVDPRAVRGARARPHRVPGEPCSAQHRRHAVLRREPGAVRAPHRAAARL